MADLNHAQRPSYIPHGPIEFDPEWIDPRKIGFVVIPGAYYSRDPARRLDMGAFPLGVSTLGRGYRPTSDTGRSQVASSANNVFDTNNCTMLLVTTLISINSGTAMNGYINGGNRVDVNLPFTDNKIYWSFGNSTTGVGRVATAGAVLSVDGRTRNFALVAGSRGREIWDGGVRIANDAGATSARSSDASPVYIGSASGSSAPIHVQHLWISLKEEWPLHKLARWGENPGVIFLPKRRVMVDVLAGGGSQSVTAAGDIASLEAFGSAAVVPGVVSVTPSGIASAEAFGAAQINQTISGAGNIASAEAFGSATVVPGVVTIAGAGAIASAEAFGDATVSSGGSFITGAGAIASAEAFGAHTVAPGAVSITGAGAIVSAEAFGTAAVRLTLLGAGAIASAETFGSAALQHGATTIIGAGNIATGEAFGDALIPGGASYILGAGNIASGEAFGPVPLIPQNYTATDRILEVEGGARILEVPGGDRVLEVLP